MQDAVPQGAEVDPLIGKVLDERYRIEETLGEGGIGRVFKARHLTLGRMVALKVLLTQYESIPVLKQRFEREAQALAALSHPNIVTVTDFGVSDGNPYLVMELLEGQDLAKVVSGEPLPPKRVFDISKQMLRALAYAHEQELVHRDLKPHNVFVRAMSDGTDHVEVLDFGLARFVGEAAKQSPKLTRQGALIGTPAYMAPEQASGEVVDARADVYAAGCVIFEALTGRRVFESNDPGEILRSHLLAAPPPLSAVDPGLDVSDRLEAFIQRALAKSPSQRFQTVQEMIAELDAIGPDGARRTGPRPPRDQPISTVAPTQAAPGATRAATPSARRDDAPPPVSVGASINIPKQRLPLIAAIGCVGGVLVGGAVLVFWLASGDPDPAAAIEPPTETPVVEPPPPPEPPRAPERPAARDPFDEALPEPLAEIHERQQRRGGQRVSRSQLSEISQFQREHPEDPRPHLILGHVYIDRRWLQFALPEYQQAYELDPSVRGDPDMLPDLLELVRSNEHEQAAADLVVEAYGAEARERIEAALEERMRSEEREHLERLSGRLPAQ